MDDAPFRGTAVLDLDGTLVKLDIDWDAVRRRVMACFPRAGCGSLANAIAAISRDGAGAREALARLLIEFEQPNGRVKFKACRDVVIWARRLDRFYVVTNNLRSTALQVIEGLGMETRCAGIVGFDDVPASKPDPAAWKELLKRYGPFPAPVLYVGDRDSDELFARHAGLGFRRVECSCV